ncbi:DUF2239 family protein [Phenylobacterium sp. 20VBR1]|uniref:DUF2239 family protein n=1 Tax=Phenylobacterium glaciei TaxID=2803784 RepID=A0A941HXG2_9CAUL|nr:DUF2239 family protein [Phenylobacterium glaciei]MBR7620430.1 DUF2239 family protein [Phenylobacterium glaciei]
MDEAATYTAFAGHQGLAAGDLQKVALAAKTAHDDGREPILVFDDATGRTVELDFRGSADEVLARLLVAETPPETARARQEQTKNIWIGQGAPNRSSRRPAGRREAVKAGTQIHHRRPGILIEYRDL